MDPEPKDVGPPASNFTILVVDDEDLFRDLVARELAQIGYQIVTASEGQEALVKAETPDLWRPRGIPDLIVADILMPVMDGFELCRRVKQDPRLKPVPFLFLSVKRETLDRARAFLAGCQRYLVKPFNRAALLKAVNERLLDARQTLELMADVKESFAGSLADYTVLALVDMFLLGGWTGTITIQARDQEARVEFASGEITTVQWGPKKDEEALADLLVQLEGTFLVSRSPAPHRTPPLTE
jgi:CheY-like chemotaxis protein